METRPEKMRKAAIIDRLIRAGVPLPKGRVLKNDLVKLYKEFSLHLPSAVPVVPEYSSEEEEDEIQATISSVKEEAAEEEAVEEAAEELQNINNTKEVTVTMNLQQDLAKLNDNELKLLLSKHGCAVGPIVSSTRKLYLKKLEKLLTDSTVSRVEKSAGQYSDNEEAYEPVAVLSKHQLNNSNCVVVSPDISMYDHVDATVDIPSEPIQTFSHSCDLKVQVSATNSASHVQANVEGGAKSVLTHRRVLNTTATTMSSSFASELDDTFDTTISQTEFTPSMMAESDTEDTADVKKTAVAKTGKCRSFFVKFLMVLLTVALIGFFVLVVHTMDLPQKRLSK